MNKGFVQGIQIRSFQYEVHIFMIYFAIIAGSMRELDVIDVAEQSDMKMLMREFVEYYNNPNKDRILNVISLEFSNTKFVFP